MKITYKVLLINLLAAVMITAVSLIVSGGSQRGSDVALAFGLVCLGMSLLNLVIGLILLIVQRSQWGSGMILSFAVLLLLSGISCSQGFQGL